MLRSRRMSSRRSVTLQNLLMFARSIVEMYPYLVIIVCCRDTVLQTSKPGDSTEDHISLSS
jgi:hypothetical protein